MKHMRLKLNFIPILNLIIDSLCGITQDSYFRENQFEEKIIMFLY